MTRIIRTYYNIKSRSDNRLWIPGAAIYRLFICAGVLLSLPFIVFSFVLAPVNYEDNAEKLEIYIVDNNYAPLANTNIRLENISGDPFSATATYDEVKQCYRFTNVPNGKYAIHINRLFYDSLSKEITISGDSTRHYFAVLHKNRYAKFVKAPGDTMRYASPVTELWLWNSEKGKADSMAVYKLLDQCGLQRIMHHYDTPGQRPPFGSGTWVNYKQGCVHDYNDDVLRKLRSSNLFTKIWLVLGRSEIGGGTMLSDEISIQFSSRWADCKKRKRPPANWTETILKNDSLVESYVCTEEAIDMEIKTELQTEGEGCLKYKINLKSDVGMGIFDWVEHMRRNPFVSSVSYNMERIAGRNMGNGVHGHVALIIFEPFTGMIYINRLTDYH